jgi:hypothetical protein
LELILRVGGYPAQVGVDEEPHPNSSSDSESVMLSMSIVKMLSLFSTILPVHR